MPVYILSLIFSLFSFCAFAQDPEPGPLPPEEQRQLLCEMAVGNLQGEVQDAADLYVVIYADEYGETEVGKYGLLTGNYYGSKGVSGFGPTLDDPHTPRFLKDGRQAQNYMAEGLRSRARAERQARCDLQVNPL